MPDEPLWRRYLRFWRPDVRADVDEELRFHLDERADDLVASGVAPGAAAEQARAEFGDLEAVRRGLHAIGERRLRRARWLERADAARRDLAYAARSLRRAPGLALTVIVTLALGLGANGALFGLVDRLFLRAPAAVAAPDGLRRVYVTQHGRTADGKPMTRGVVNYPEFLDVRAGVGAAARLVPYLVDDTRPDPDGPALTIVYAGAGYFDLLGVRPALGRVFGGDEERVDVAAPVVVLSDAHWRRHFGADPRVIGRTIELDHQRLTVVGVAPPRFAGVDVGAVDAWRPLGAFPGQRFGYRAWYQSRNMYALHVLGRPAAGADERQLAARATTTFRRGDPGDGYLDTLAVVHTGSIIAAREPSERRREVSIAARLAGVALLVLLIACANVANLLLARAVERRREIAVRLALGVRAGRLRAMLLAEGVLLALAGAVAALLVAAAGGAALRRWLLPDVHWDDGASLASLDPRVAAFVVAAAVGTGLVAALAPALRASRPDLTRALKAGAREGTFQHSRLRVALVVVQTALSVVLLVGAGLFVRSLRNVRALDVGYDVDRIVDVSARFDDAKDVDAGRAQARRLADALPAVTERLRREPGVARVAAVTNPPMYGFSFLTMFVEGRDSLPSTPAGPPAFTGVSPEFFAATGMRVLRGRGFTAADRGGAPRVLAVNATMARTLWPGGDAVGRCVRFGARTGPCFTVVGVVSDARRMSVIEEPSMLYYLPLAQVPDSGFRAGALVVRVADPARVGAVVDAARRALRTALPEATPRVRRMAERLAPELRPWRLGATLFALLGALALVVAAVGVYSTLAYTVGRRTHEIGVRVALGARAVAIVRLVVRDGLRAVAAGAAAGVGLALLGGRLVASLLYGVSPRDPLVLGVVVLVLLGAALLASLVPAWRAVRTAPVTALREE